MHRWSLGEPRVIDGSTREGRERLKREQKLEPCMRCKRKSTLKLWKVMPPREQTTWDRERGNVGTGEYLVYAQVVCADKKDCLATINRRYEKQREAADRRRPRMPNAGGPGCDFCGEAIEFDETKPGWKRRRQRGYHRHDEWEKPVKRRPHPTLSCNQLASYWMNPKSADRFLLTQQAGRCAICEAEIGHLVSEEFEWLWEINDRDMTSRPERLYYAPGPDHPRTEVDHILAIADGGSNDLANLQLICHKPCHVEKTGREARERNARRKEVERTASLALL